MFENNKAIPPDATAQRLAAALNIDIARLMSPEAPINTSVMRAGERQSLADGNITLERLTLPGRNGLLQAGIHTIQEGGSSDRQSENVSEEMGYVLQGKLELVLDGNCHVLEAEDSFSLINGLPHSYRNIGDGPLKILWVRTPSAEQSKIR